jgi:hypothetical protein
MSHKSHKLPKAEITKFEGSTFPSIPGSFYGIYHTRFEIMRDSNSLIG